MVRLFVQCLAIYDNENLPNNLPIKLAGKVINYVTEQNSSFFVKLEAKYCHNDHKQHSVPSEFLISILSVYFSAHLSFVRHENI